MNPSQRIGIYGGTFDPVHHGHLILARQALEELALDRIIFVPAGISPHKLGHPPAPAGIRCDMLAAAIEGEAAFEWDDCEVKRTGPSYALDTVRIMRERFPGDKIFYLIGEDNLAALHTWKEIDTLETLAQFVVLSRSGTLHECRFPVVSRVVDISSTEIRNRIANGLPVSYLLPEAACQILTRNRLYRND